MSLTIHRSALSRRESRATALAGTRAGDVGALEPAPPGPWTVTHDFAFVDGGAELVTRALADDVLGGAPVTVLAGGDPVTRSLSTGEVTSLLARVPVTERSHRLLTPLYPVVARVAPVIEGNVIASSYAFSHHLRCTGAKVVYCHTPLRQVWSGRAMYEEHGSWAQRRALAALAPALRRADVRAAQQADLYLATSAAVRERIERCYGRTDVPVIPPPVDTSVFRPDGPTEPAAEGSLLWVGRVVEPYKRLELVIEAVRGTGRRLVVVGDGRDRERLERSAPAEVVFLGWQGRSALARLYRAAQAVVFPSEDDFGLVPVEAMACGTPCVALRRGGAVDTVREGLTGTFFDEPALEQLREAIDRCADRTWDPAAVAAWATTFGRQRFVERVRGAIGHLAPVSTPTAGVAPLGL